MKLAQSVAFSIALCVPSTAIAEQAAPALAKPKSSSAAPDKLICHVEEETGSRLSKKKVCMTAAQWRESSFEAGQRLERGGINAGRPDGN
jgi:hypothetical protein